MKSTRAPSITHETPTAPLLPRTLPTPQAILDVRMAVMRDSTCKRAHAHDTCKYVRLGQPDRVYSPCVCECVCMSTGMQVAYRCVCEDQQGYGHERLLSFLYTHTHTHTHTQTAQLIRHTHGTSVRRCAAVKPACVLCVCVCVRVAY